MSTTTDTVVECFRQQQVGDAAPPPLMAAAVAPLLDRHPGALPAAA
ncbi:hypothetical protein ACWEHA_09600 [Amycolatopsis nivea]